MAEQERAAPRLTVGSLLGVPLGSAPGPAPGGAPPPSAGMRLSPLPAAEIESAGWTVRGGEVRLGEPPAGIGANGVERLDYNNPFNQVMERVWFDGKIVYAVDLGEIDVDPSRVKVAQEYQIVYNVELDDAGKLKRPPELVPGQLNIYDSIPGMEKYSPIWQFNYVVVPRDYQPNTLRSESDCLSSGYRILHSAVFEN
jgi:hypothetical protein